MVAGSGFYEAFLKTRDVYMPLRKKKIDDTGERGERLKQNS